MDGETRLKRGREVVEILLDVVNPEKTPHLSMTDRFILVLFEMGIATREQIAAVSGWSRNQVAGAIQRARAMGGNPEEWVRSWSYSKNKPSVYALGEAGVVHARQLRGEYDGDERRKRPVAGQVYHFLGTNNILVRLLKSGMEVSEWLSGKGVASFLYNELLVRTEPGKLERRPSPVRPDAMVTVNESCVLVEYDAGTEGAPRLTEKFSRYLDLANMMAIPPVLFVTVSESRRETAVRAFERALERYPNPETLGENLPDVLFCVEGEEPEYLRTYLGISGRA